jgi:hypothetical protein
MNKTKHAMLRQSQRGISDAILSIIQKHGKYENAPGGAIKIFFGNREYQAAATEMKKYLQDLEKAKGGTLIIVDNDLCTVYKQ